MKTPEAQKVWDALKKIYGKKLAAITVTALIVDGDRVTLTTVVLPNDLKEQANENT
jgi:hypothetical protein